METRPGQRVMRLDRETRLLVDVGGGRGDLLFGQLPHGVAQRLMLLAELIPACAGVHRIHAPDEPYS